MYVFFGPNQRKIHKLNLNFGQWDSGIFDLIQKV